MKRLIVSNILFLALIAFATVLIWRVPSKQSRQAINKPTATAMPTPNPLAIETMRRHPTPGGPIAVESEVEGRGGCRTFVVSYPSDGLKVYALMQQPATPQPASGYPTILLLHGYIPPTEYSTTSSDYQEFMNSYCSHGYLVFKPDFRGNGNSGGNPAGGHFAPDYTYDVLNLISSLKSISLADAGKVGIIGHSMGAHVALKTAVISSQVKATVVVSGVVGSLEDIAYNWPNLQIPPDAVASRDKILAAIGSPAQNPSWWHDGSAINYVGAIAGPVQIHYGLSDVVVPLLFSQHLDEALTKSNKPHQFYTYPETDHQFLNSTSRQLLFDRSLELLEKM